MASRKSRGILRWRQFDHGDFYKFIYNPMGRRTLRHYDLQPIIWFSDFSIEKSVIQGVNLHYIQGYQGSTRIITKMVNMNKNGLKDVLTYDRFHQHFKNGRDLEFLKLAWKSYIPQRVTEVIKVSSDEIMTQLNTHSAIFKNDTKKGIYDDINQEAYRLNEIHKSKGIK
jgi:hypothetical protein